MTVGTVGAAVERFASDPSTATARAYGSDGWTRVEHLLAMVVDALNVANWQRTKDGQKNRNRPERISPLAGKGNRIGRTSRPAHVVAKVLARIAGRG